MEYTNEDPTTSTGSMGVVENEYKQPTEEEMKTWDENN